MKVISPICWDGGESVKAFTLSLAERLQFECYPRNENVVTEGSIVRAMYFVIKGHLQMQSRSLLARPVGLRDGSYFGERGLLGCTISAYTVRSVRACDLLSLSSEAFAQVLQQHAFSRLALQICTSAHKHLKAQYHAPCSRVDMEDRWGEALLHCVKEFQSVHEAAVANTSAVVSADRANVAATPDASFSDIEAPRLSSFFRRGGTESELNLGEGGSVVACEARADDSAELPTRLREMFNALDTTTTCYEAFAALLHCMLPTDPLDWDATFATATNTDLTATLSASGSISYRYRSVLPTIDASFNAKEEPVDGRQHAHHEEQERDQVEETGEIEAREEEQHADDEAVAGPTIGDAMAAMVAEVPAPATSVDHRQPTGFRPTVVHLQPQLLPHPLAGPHVRDL